MSWGDRPGPKVQVQSVSHPGLEGTLSHVCCCRIVVAGSLLQSSVVPGSAVPFDFQAAYGLSNEMVSICPGHTAFFLLT